MADQRETGEYVEGGELHIRNSEIYLLETDETLVDVDLDQDGWISYDRDGTEIETVKAKLVFLDFVLYQNKNEWKIRAVGDGSQIGRAACRDRGERGRVEEGERE